MFSEQIIYKYKLTKNKITFLKKVLYYNETINPDRGKIKEYKAIIWASDINIGFDQLLVVLYQDVLTSKNFPLSYVIMKDKTNKLFKFLNNFKLL